MLSPLKARKVDNFIGAITLERAIKKRSKELVPKLEQRLIAKEKVQNCYHNNKKWTKSFCISGYIHFTEIFYKIVSEYEADVSKGLISITSPLAKALIGKKVNESLEFNTPKGIKYYQIMSVDYI